VRTLCLAACLTANSTPCTASEPKASCDSSVDAVTWFRRARVVGKLAWFSRDRAALAGWIAAVALLLIFPLMRERSVENAMPTIQVEALRDR